MRLHNLHWIAQSVHGAESSCPDYFQPGSQADTISTKLWVNCSTLNLAVRGLWLAAYLKKKHTSFKATTNCLTELQTPCYYTLSQCLHYEFLCDLVSDSDSCLLLPDSTFCCQYPVQRSVPPIVAVEIFRFSFKELSIYIFLLSAGLAQDMEALFAFRGSCWLVYDRMKCHYHWANSP